MIAPTRFPDPPPLVAGDHLTAGEFMRRYEAMPEYPKVKAELIEGVVYMSSGVRDRHHGRPVAMVVNWLGQYELQTTGMVRVSTDSTTRLDIDNVPQPDGILRVVPECGGSSIVRPDGYLQGPPELVVEVSASSVSYDLHEEKNAFRRNGIREYVVWRVMDRAVDWFVLREGRYVAIEMDADDVYRSVHLPGLWLDVNALVHDDLTRVVARLHEGAATSEHAEFVARTRSGELPE